MKHVIQEAFGTVTITDEFPSVIKTFKDAPSGYFLIRKNEPVASFTTFYYHIDLVPPRFRKEHGTDDITATFVKRIALWLSEGYGAQGKAINFPKGFENVLQWMINPAQVKGTRGTVQLIHGSSSGMVGYNNFELYFPGLHTFSMRGNWDGTPPEPARSAYVGHVRFAKRDYKFALMSGAGAPAIRGTDKMDYEQLVEAYRNERSIVHYMTPEDAATEMRYWIERWFSFVKDYGMLEDFVFITPQTPEEAATKKMELNAKAGRENGADEDQS